MLILSIIYNIWLNTSSDIGRFWPPRKLAETLKTATKSIIFIIVQINVNTLKGIDLLIVMQWKQTPTIMIE